MDKVNHAILRVAESIDRLAGPFAQLMHYGVE